MSLLYDHFQILVPALSLFPFLGARTTATAKLVCLMRIHNRVVIGNGVTYHLNLCFLQHMSWFMNWCNDLHDVLIMSDIVIIHCFTTNFAILYVLSLPYQECR